MSTPLLLDNNVRQSIRELVALAHANPVQIADLGILLSTPEGKAHHMALMSRQTITIPFAYLVTFSIEVGQPTGTCRHMSMSVQRDGRLPNEHAVWMIAQEFGFWGTLVQCSVWLEKLQGHGQAINIIQPIENQPN